jgi:hypothetical protein
MRRLGFDRYTAKEMFKGEKSAWREAVKGVLSLLALTFVVHFLVASFPARQQGADFPEFYAAARIVLEGQGHGLYDLRTQELFQRHYFNRLGTYFNHPAYETLIYLPFALFSLITAYSLWSWFNGGLLVVFVILVAKNVLPSVGWPFLILASLVFPCVLLNFFQGQDSVLLLVLITGSVLALRENKDAAAGCLLACGLFKFHLVLPLVILLLCLRKKRALLSFSVGLLGLVAVCIAISGPQFVTSYVNFLKNISALPLAGIHPSQMANLRGLVALLGVTGFAGLSVTLVLSFATILWPVWLCSHVDRASRAQFDLLAGAFVLAALLVSYHLSPHDLSLLLISFALIARHLLSAMSMPFSLRTCMMSSAVILFLPPLHIILMSVHLYSLATVPLLAFFVCACLEVQRTTKVGPARG